MLTTDVDFAIITALKVEREAMVQRLTNCNKVQNDDEALTFYTGSIGPYSVVVTQLLEAGNVEAAAVTTRVISRWRSRNVLMVGIAGGVKGKVLLGDVLVAEYAHYYEPGKAMEAGIQLRSRQFDSNKKLYGRSQHYNATEWTLDIRVSRPDLTCNATGAPRVHFGPIACGELVIANDDDLKRIEEHCPKMIGVAMEGVGVAKAVSHVDNPPRYLEIRGVSDYAGPAKNDAWHEYAANAAAAYTSGFLRTCPVPPGSSLDEPHISSVPSPVVQGTQIITTVSHTYSIPASSASDTTRAPIDAHLQLNRMERLLTTLVEQSSTTTHNPAVASVTHEALLAPQLRRVEDALVDMRFEDAEAVALELESQLGILSLTPQFKARCYFVLARAATSAAKHRAGEKGSPDLTRARSLLALATKVLNG